MLETKIKFGCMMEEGKVVDGDWVGDEWPYTGIICVSDDHDYELEPNGDHVEIYPGIQVAFTMKDDSIEFLIIVGQWIHHINMLDETEGKGIYSIVDDGSGPVFRGTIETEIDMVLERMLLPEMVGRLTFEKPSDGHPSIITVYNSGEFEVHVQSTEGQGDHLLTTKRYHPSARTINIAQDLMEKAADIIKLSADLLGDGGDVIKT